MEGLAIGIDLGTTNSCAAYYIAGRVKILENSEGGRITPSVVFYTEKGAAIVGQFAKRMAEAKPEYAVYEIKRLVGRKRDDSYVQNNLRYFPFKLDDSTNDPVVVIDHPSPIRRSPLDVCAAILTKIKQDVETKLGCSVDKAVITVPAYFNVDQRRVTYDAARKAGFTVLKLFNEPTAAALSYYLENDCEPQNHALVYDLGGGTFDVAVLKRSFGNIDIVGVDGDSHLGGQDFDNLIINHVCELLKQGFNYSPRSDRRQMRRLHVLCEDAKKILSVADETTIFLSGFVKNHDSVEILLTRQQFEAMSDDLFQKTITIIDNCLRSCQLPKTAIKEVILSGGSTRIPKIQELLSTYFEGKTLNKFVNPDECVAEGAALQAAMLCTNPRQRIDAIRITDVVPLSLGVGNFVDVMTVLIKRNTPIPVSQTEVRVNVYDQQKSMTFSIYEGERSNVKKNHCLGKLTIGNITPAPPGQCEVTVTMEVDKNGILTVSAREKYKDNFKDLTVAYTRGHFSDSEVKNAVKDAEEHEEEDRAFRRFASQKEYLMEYCIRAVYNFESKGLGKKHKKEYDLCREFKEKASVLGVEKEDEVKTMTKEVEKLCQGIVGENDFELMPIYRP